jgi:hypothetical protein
MSHPHRFTRDQHSDHIETVDLAWPAMTVDPNACRARQLALFAPVDCLDWTAEVHGAPSLYLDEGHETVPLDDEIDVAMARSESALKDAPTGSLQPALGDPLSEETKLSPFL